MTMKYFLSICLLLILFSCGRSSEPKELQDYSYLIWDSLFSPSEIKGKTKIDARAASAFFVKKNDRLFLVSAAHSFNVPDSSTYIHSFFIKLYNKNEDVSEPYRIDVSSVSQV